MKISRSTAERIQFFFDQIIPPIIRDSRWFMHIPLKLVLKDKYQIFTDFKNNALCLSKEEFSKKYEYIESVIIKRETDLNEACITAILKNIVGSTVLEAGCGKGFLAKKMSEKYEVTATDIIIDSRLASNHTNIRFQEANVEDLPFKDKEFDTVVCTHTLQHVQNIFMAIHELKRVAKKRLIVVVPKQRSYKYTFDLHLHFFPYEYSLLALMNVDNKVGLCKEIGGDLFYMEDIMD